jgi:cytochrome P450
VSAFPQAYFARQGVLLQVILTWRITRQRQRRIVAPNLSERISKLVWQESCRQAQTMLDHLLIKPGDETLDGLKRIAINILGHVGYGNTQDWIPDADSQTETLRKEDLNYFNAISLITIYLMESAFLPPWLMKLSFMPKYMHILGNAVEDIPRYTKALLDGERKAAKQESGSRNYFLSMLVKLSDQTKCEGGTALALTDDEISGNLFVFSAAGFDTTANTMGYAVTLLAAHPEWQDWVHEELSTFNADVSLWDYDETYPKCRRVLAVMVCSGH